MEQRSCTGGKNKNLRQRDAAICRSRSRSRSYHFGFGQRTGNASAVYKFGLGRDLHGADEVNTQSEKFLRLAAAGVNVFISSGDAGSNPDVTGHNASGPTQAEYESSDENVISVGGTSLNLGSSGAVTSETAWIGSGGG